MRDLAEIGALADLAQRITSQGSRHAVSLAIMEDEAVAVLDRMLDSGDPAGALDFLISRYRSAANLGLLFEAKLMKKRLELGLPLIQTEASSEFPAEARGVYERAMVDVAREVGELGLEHGDILGAWPYFRAIGETSRVAAAIEGLRGEEGSDAIIEIALQEGVHPSKGLEFILARHGMCRAITCFGMYPIRNGRPDCIALLVRSLHAEILERMGGAIESQEGVKPPTSSIPEMIAGRQWLFGEYDTYVDTSHLLSLLPYSVETSDQAILELFRQLCEYGKHLSPMFQSHGQPPFEQPFIDYGHYIEARLGMNIEDHVLHFRNKLKESDPEEAATAPAEVLVNLLVELHRYEEAFDISERSLSDQSMRLCHLAGNYARMRELAREKGDSLSYLAATVLARRK